MFYKEKSFDIESVERVMRMKIYKDIKSKDMKWFYYIWLCRYHQNINIKFYNGDFKDEND